MDIAALAKDTVTLEIVHPENGEPIGLTIELRSPTADEIKAVDRKWQTKRMRSRDGRLGYDQAQKAGIDTLVASVATWEWGKDKDGEQNDFDGEVPDDTDKWKEKVLSSDKAWFIVKQINEAYKDEAGFFSG